MCVIFFFVLAGPEPELSEVVPPRFIEPLKPQLVAEGEVVIMETHVESHPVCSFQWFQHSVAIKVSDLCLCKYMHEPV